MNEIFVKVTMQIALILFSGIYSMSIVSHFGDKKHNNHIYPYISSIILLGFLPILNDQIQNSEIGIVCLYVLVSLKLINTLTKNDKDKKWLVFLGVFISLASLAMLSSPAYTQYLIHFYTFIIFLIIVFLNFIFGLKTEDKILKFSRLMPIPISMIFIYLDNITFLAYLLFAAFALFDARKLYQDIKNTKSEFDARLELLEKDFSNELEKGVKKRTFYVERLKDRMAEVNRIDHLTKALNRKAITITIDDLVASSEVTHFVLLLFDIDKFKNINDTYGHVTGDVCLKNLATLAFKNIRNVDFLGRYGGDEFIILLPNQTLKEGLRAAERFRSKVAETQNPHFTISIGAAAYPWDGDTMTALLSTADKGLYVSKENNRNRVSYDGYIKLDS